MGKADGYAKAIRYDLKSMNATTQWCDIIR